MALCGTCEGRGWIVEVEGRADCCRMAEYECGGRGCRGPVEVPVEVQVQCPECHGYCETPPSGGAGDE